MMDIYMLLMLFGFFSLFSVFLFWCGKMIDEQGSVQS